jgi:hypothetical protein
MEEKRNERSIESLQDLQIEDEPVVNQDMVNRQICCKQNKDVMTA